jgi:hypothetical protein
MKANFKQLGLAAAVAAASAGYAGITNAQAEVSGNGLGDMAIVPYYTVRGDFVTGVHIINTSAKTQIVKLRLRRATDSMDALDFNLIMSPFDEWTGYIKNDEDGGQITFNSTDTTCTAPALINGQAPMPPIYNLGAETGYIEVIGMATPHDEDEQIAIDAKHNPATGLPRSCARVAENFLADGVLGSKPGVVNSATTVQTSLIGDVAGIANNFYDDATDALKVSFFVRDGTSGVEFGSNAQHFSGFMEGPSMTNQERGIFSGDMQGFDFPDLNGGAPGSVVVATNGQRGKFEELRLSAIAGNRIINDWSNNANASGFAVGTDWVVTAPGQYVMLDLAEFVPNAIGTEEGQCELVPPSTTVRTDCDHRDIPLTASFTVWDREENGIIIDPGELVFSPTIPGLAPVVSLAKEVNVVQWGDLPVLDAPLNVVVPVPEETVNGWADLAVTAAARATGQQVCDFNVISGTQMMDPNDPISCVPVVDNTKIPMVGFVAWERSFADNPDANYGRIIDHSYAGS